MPFPVLKINVLQKYNGGSDYVLLQLLNGSMKGKIYTIIGFLALAVLVTAAECLAQKVIPKQPARTLVPAKKLTLADPDRNAPKPKMEPDLYTRGFSLSNWQATPVYSGMQNLGWGWFCHAEHRFRQTTKIPLFVRLGSVEQANRLEGK
jgi:hypothetical protein